HKIGALHLGQRVLLQDLAVKALALHPVRGIAFSLLVLSPYLIPTHAQRFPMTIAPPAIVHATEGNGGHRQSEAEDFAHFAHAEENPRGTRTAQRHDRVRPRSK